MFDEEGESQDEYAELIYPEPRKSLDELIGPAKKAPGPRKTWDAFKEAAKRRGILGNLLNQQEGADSESDDDKYALHGLKFLESKQKIDEKDSGFGELGFSFNLSNPKFMFGSLGQAEELPQIPESVRKIYPERFSDDELKGFCDAECPADFVKEYPAPFTGPDILRFFEYEIEAEVASLYSATLLDTQDIKHSRSPPFHLSLGIGVGWPSNLYRSKTPPKNDDLGLAITFLVKSGTSPENAKGNRVMLNNIGELIRYLRHSESCANIHIIGAGNEGFVVRDGKRAIKFTKNYFEKSLLSQIERNNPSLDNVVRLSKDGDRFESIGVNFDAPNFYSLEYIPGPTLQEMIDSEGKLSPDKVIKYGRGVLNGLTGLYNGGLPYHGDIRPSNIIIADKDDKPFIIDFGIAASVTKERKNRSYTSYSKKPINDLVSLGQVMYKIATGFNLFSPSPDADERLAVIKDEIQIRRDEAYSRWWGLRHYMKKIYENVEDKDVAAIIKACLKSKPNHHEKIQKLFQGYAA